MWTRYPSPLIMPSTATKSCPSPDKCWSHFPQMVNKVFKELIRSTMEVYVNDMLVKRLDCSDHMKHLEETFAFLGKFNVKLNHEKCTLEVASVKFLRYLVTQ